MAEKFQEIDVERINIVDPDGTLRLTISNKERQPDAVMDGKFLRSRKGETGAGFIFFNEEGDECGGFNWRGAKTEDGFAAGAGFSFDQFKQDEALTMSYNENQEGRFIGLRIQDRPSHETPISKIVSEELHPAMESDESPEKAEKIATIRQKFAGKERVMLGRGRQGEAALVLGDSKGRPRIKIYVDADDTPKFEVLGEDGEVTFSLPLG
jgi:hypothetical protein